MQIATRRSGEILVIDLAGRLDSHTVGEVTDAITAIGTSGEKRVIANLAGVDYMSSAGLRVLLRLARLLQSHGGELKLAAAQPLVATVVETAGFDSLMRMHASEAGAIGAFGKG